LDLEKQANIVQGGSRTTEIQGGPLIMTTTGVQGADALTRRLVQLYLGLALYGGSMALQIRSTLGLDPWDVFHQGLTRHIGLSFGTVTMIVGAAVLLLWIPLRQRPGLGTISNVFVIGLSVDAGLALIPTLHGLLLRLAVLAAGIVLNGVAGGLYIGARFGPGPRDGLMTGFCRRTGRSVRLVRTVIEVTVLLVGLTMGGTFGIGTVAYALAIGPLVQFFLPLFTVPVPERTTGTSLEAVTPACEPAAAG
jgi:uncharacterized membrane protein YczE